jgi:hypothetical protein
MKFSAKKRKIAEPDPTDKVKMLLKNPLRTTMISAIATMVDG